MLVEFVRRLSNIFYVLRSTVLRELKIVTRRWSVSNERYFWDLRPRSGIDVKRDVSRPRRTKVLRRQVPSFYRQYDRSRINTDNKYSDKYSCHLDGSVGFASSAPLDNQHYRRLTGKPFLLNFLAVSREKRRAYVTLTYGTESICSHVAHVLRSNGRNVRTWLSRKKRKELCRTFVTHNYQISRDSRKKDSLHEAPHRSRDPAALRLTWKFPQINSRNTSATIISPDKTPLNAFEVSK